MISVIVPVYNVEAYLHRCLSSLAGSVAHYHACPDLLEEIEIIVIDDGSTDRSGHIADLYAERYPFFRVFHTGNHGLSAARNFGIKNSSGDYLMFVDSDDWVCNSFIETPYRTAVSYNADMVIFRYYRIGQNGCEVGKRSEFKHHVNGAQIVNCEKAFDSGGVVVWNKLYKRSLFERIQFPEGRVYEDVATTHKLIYKANRIVMIDERLMYQFYRNGSISRSRSSVNRNDAILSSLQRYSELLVLGYPADKALMRLQNTVLGCVAVLNPVNCRKYRDAEISFDPNHNYNGDELYCIAEKIVDDIKGIPKSFSAKQKAMLIVWKLNKPLFHWICRVCGKKVVM